ncbi:hypothetical protein KBD69_02825 [Candidatus Woesebacteria bacterium]|nr:hypothetical protein [Candidatus Woesebacteria bacterium]
MYEVIFNYKFNTKLVYTTTTPDLVHITRDGIAMAQPGSEVSFTAGGELFALIRFFHDLIITVTEGEDDFDRIVRFEREKVMQFIGETVMLDDGSSHVEIVRV